MTYFFGDEHKGVKRTKSHSTSLQAKTDWKSRAKRTEYISIDEISKLNRVLFSLKYNRANKKRG